MIRALIQLGMIGFEVVGAWIRSEIGVADYRIVRLVFVSALVAAGALGLVRLALTLADLFRRLVTFYAPFCPELFLLLGWISREEYYSNSYRIFRRIGWAIATLCDRLNQRFRSRTARQRT